MTDDFDFDLPWPTKVKLAKYALAGAAIIVAAVGAYFSFAFDSFRVALAKIGIDATKFPSTALEIAVLAAIFIVVSLGIYCGLSQYVRRHILQLS